MTLSLWANGSCAIKNNIKKDLKNYFSFNLNNKFLNSILSTISLLKELFFKE